MPPAIVETAIDVAAFNHHAAIAALLDAAGLPVPDDRDAPMTMLAALAGGAPVGCAGWERYGAAALLRSVAVHPDWRARGLGLSLVLAACDRLAGTGVAEIYLFTNGAADFFARQGFTAVDRSAVPAPLLASSSFCGECCAAATAMRRRATAGPPAPR